MKGELATTAIEIGGWKISARESATSINVEDKKGLSVARVRRRPDDLSIARLIAAAPELLAACQLALTDHEIEGLELNRDTVKALRAAVTKSGEK